MRAVFLFSGVLAVLLFVFAGAPRVLRADAGGWIRDAATGCAVWSDDASPEVSVTWTGPCIDGKASGEGTLQRSRGDRLTSRYQGSYSAGRRHGQGTWWAANGDIYDGEWRDDQAAGRGVLRFAAGGRYEGDFRSFRFHGKGIWVGPNGDRYEGGFADGEFEGKGILTYADGGSYEGEFAAGQFQGLGELRIATGEVFAGRFVQSRPHGVGRCGVATGEKRVLRVPRRQFPKLDRVTCSRPSPWLRTEPASHRLGYQLSHLRWTLA